MSLCLFGFLLVINYFEKRSLNVYVNSISDVIPRCVEDNDAQAVTQIEVLKNSPVQRERTSELRGTDFGLRKVVWDAEKFVHHLDTHISEQFFFFGPSTSEHNSKSRGPVGTRLGNNSIPREIANEFQRACSLVCQHLVPFSRHECSRPIQSSVSPGLLPTQILETNDLTTPQAIQSHIIAPFNKTNETAMDTSIGQSCDISTQALTEFLLKRDTNANGFERPFTPAGEFISSNAPLQSVAHSLTERNDVSWEMQKVPSSPRFLTDLTDSPTQRSEKSDNSTIDCDCGILVSILACYCLAFPICFQG